jgi:hypothetical protein
METQNDKNISIFIEIGPNFKKAIQETMAYARNENGITIQRLCESCFKSISETAKVIIKNN